MVVRVEREKQMEQDSKQIFLPGGKCAGFRISSTKKSPIPIKLHRKINNSISIAMFVTMHAHNITVKNRIQKFGR